MTDRGDRESSATVDHVGGDSWSPDRWWRRRSILLAAGFVALWVISIASGISGVFDWDKETLYAVALHDGGMTGAPYLWALPEWAKRYPALQHSRVLLANPETPALSPLRCLFLVFDPVRALRVLSLLHGIAGLVFTFLLARRLEWSETQRAVFVGGVFLSPAVMQHLSIGYTPWFVLYLLPAIPFFIHSGNWWVGGIGLGLTIGWGLLQGASHAAMWLAVITGLVLLLEAVRMRSSMPCQRLLVAALVSFAVGFPRLACTWPVYRDFSQTLVPGYQLATFVFWALLPPMSPRWFVARIVGGVPAWDGAIFWGGFLPGLGLMTLWIARRWCGRAGPVGPASSYTGAALVLLLISLEPVYQTIITVISNVANPQFLIAAEKYPFRWALLAYLCTVVAVTFALGKPEAATWLAGMTHRCLAWVRRTQLLNIRPWGAVMLDRAAQPIGYRVAAGLLILPGLAAFLFWYAIGHLALPMQASDYAAEARKASVVFHGPQAAAAHVIACGPNRIVLSSLQTGCSLLTEWPGGDIPYLRVSSGNAILERQNGFVSIRCTGGGPIAIEHAFPKFSKQL